MYENGYMNEYDMYGQEDMMNGQMPGQNNGMWVDPFANDVVDYDKMKSLGFEDIVLSNRNTILQMYGKLTNKTFYMCGVTNPQLKQDILYADKIIRGLVPIDTKEDLKKHLQKMHFASKVSIGALGSSISPKNELKVIVRGLPQKSLFGIYNSEEPVTADTVTSKYVTIYSDKYYKIKAYESKQLFKVKDLLNNKSKYYKRREEIEKNILDNPNTFKVEKVAELLDMHTFEGTKKIAVLIHRDFCRVLGRYMIVASLRTPDLHLGAYELLSKGGTSVFVFAKQIKVGAKAEIKYASGTERVYFIGTKYDDIETNLARVTNQVSQAIGGHFYSEKLEATTEFIPIEPWETDTEENEYGEPVKTEEETPSET